MCVGLPIYKNENDQSSDMAGPHTAYILPEVCLRRSIQLSRGSNSKESTQSMNQLEGAIHTLPWRTLSGR